MTEKYSCPCCKYLTLSEEPPGTFEICPVCYWEDDNLQYAEPDRVGGANSICLREAKSNFKDYGAISLEFLDAVRLPLEEEKTGI
ncbi:CPCC family cysteine-rich protein [Paenibacillus sp. Leaf72]|uniref:CPCC family cysteine-rich protein n=1 Tax=Paenibacillus sp. Leaf72 TaxID=1736234 RepID=UPI0006FA6713|nr:CPCC family cysteine-rich protein [Paenibacillus sp. Leaf72]KQN97049.1 hydrolase [Paenibacillus sp. Leaf72]